VPRPIKAIDTLAVILMADSAIEATSSKSTGYGGFENPCEKYSGNARRNKADPENVATSGDLVVAKKESLTAENAKGAEKKRRKDMLPSFRTTFVKNDQQPESQVGQSQMRDD
jgi:hypothetical protein